MMENNKENIRSKVTFKYLHASENSKHFRNMFTHYD